MAPQGRRLLRRKGQGKAGDGLPMKDATVDKGADRQLRCVALPILGHEIGAPLARIFALWADSRFRPCRDPGHPQATRPHLLVVANRATPAQLDQARAIFDAHPVLASCFGGFSAESAGLDGDRDLYLRDNAGRPGGAFGNKAGPNFLFQTTMHLAGAFGGWTLQLETDCLPVEAGWLEATQEVVEGGSRAWVIGSIYAGRSGLDSSIRSHLNGNALYKAGDPAFRQFLDDVWIAGILADAQSRPDLAYDCWWALSTHRANSMAGSTSWELYQTYDSFFRNDPFMVNLKVRSSEAQEFARVFDRLAALDRAPLFFHGEAMKAVLPLLAEYPGDTIFDAIGRLDPLPQARLRPAGGRSLTDLAAKLAPGLDRDDGRNASLLLTSCATALLLEPQVTLAELARSAALRQAVRVARRLARPAATAHFLRVLADSRSQQDQFADRALRQAG
jgi:hypothetical protein